MQDDQPTFGHFRPQGMMTGLLAMTRNAAPGWLGKRRAFLLRSLGIAALRGRPLDLEPLGAKMRLHPAHSNAEKRLAFTPQYFDATERAFLLAHMPEDMIFVDVGADVGGYALSIAAAAGTRARILAIEPQPDIFARLVYNIRQNSFATIKALACAVTDADGPVTLFVNPQNSGETSMRIVNAHARSRQITVQGRSLAGLLAEERLPRIDAMKLDIEGAEDLVLEPFFRDTAEALWPTILIIEEFPAGWGLDLAALLRTCGYGVAARTESNVIYRRA